MSDITDSESDLRIGSLNRISNERTDVRTYVTGQDVTLSGSFAERAPAYPDWRTSHGFGGLANSARPTTHAQRARDLLRADTEGDDHRG